MSQTTTETTATTATTSATATASPATASTEAPLKVGHPSVVLFPGSFNPPTLGHVEAVMALREVFDHVVVIPLQPNEWSAHDWYTDADDSAYSTRFIPPVHHATMADLAFSTIPRVTVDLEYLESEKKWRYSEIVEKFSHLPQCFSPTCPFGMAEEEEGEKRGDDAMGDATGDVKRCKSNRVRFLSTSGVAGCSCAGKVVPEVWSAFGEDVLLAPQRHPIMRSDRVAWEGGRFVVFQCEETAGMMGALPRRCVLLPQVKNRIRSSEVRAAVYNTEDVSAMVPPLVQDHIASFMLYRGVPPPTTLPYVLSEIRALLYWDSFNPTACEVKKTFEPLEDTANPNVILVIGGDGTMIRAIREYWRTRLPFFGINCGHLGFLHNELNAAKAILRCNSNSNSNNNNNNEEKRIEEELPKAIVHYLPLFRVECELVDGSASSDICFNDTWLERASGQSAWVRISINDEVKIEKMVGDGVLVSTAAGSTAYAQAMGCCPIPVGTPLMCLTGSNVSTPLAWRPTYLPLNCSVAFEGLNLEKRPLRGFVDGVDLGLVKKMNVRTSNIGNCRLIFLEPISLLSKLSTLQFP